MHVTWDKQAEHAAALIRGLARLPAGFCAALCYWCKGHTALLGEGHCHVCGHGKFYGSALGLLSPNGEPAPESVVNQVLIAGRDECSSVTGSQTTAG